MKGKASGTYFKSRVNSVTERPVALTSSPMVTGLIGLFLGITRIVSAFLMTMCPDWRTIRNPAFSKARMACW